MKKHSIVMQITAAVLFIVLASPTGALGSGRSRERRYTIKDLGAIVAPPGQPYAIADNGLIAGAARSDTTSPLHAVLWYRGLSLNIGQRGLGGPNNMALGVNDRGEAVGAAQTQTSDLRSEDFCGLNVFGLPPSNTTCVPFMWRYGTMYPLPTLGGPNGMANRINNQGEVVGLAETNTTEPNCPVYQFKPVVWVNGKPHALPTPTGDTDGVAAWINDKGQISAPRALARPSTRIAGCISPRITLCFGKTAAHRPISAIWAGRGGIAGNHACGINNRTQVVGHSELANNTTFHGFVWSRETHMQDLGVYGNDYASLAIGINDQGTIAGASLDANFTPRAVFWEDGVVADLNQRVAGSSDLYMLVANSLNNSGEIVGFAANGKGELRGFFRAIPTDGAEHGDHGTEAFRPALTPGAHQLLRQLLAQRHHVGRP